MIEVSLESGFPFHLHHEDGSSRPVSAIFCSLILLQVPLLIPFKSNLIVIYRTWLLFYEWQLVCEDAEATWGEHLWRMSEKNDWKEVLMIQKQLPRDEEVEL